MAPQSDGGAARGRGGGGGGGVDKDAKHMFDRIGKEVYEEVHDAAKKFTSQLHGDLSQATFEKEQKGPQTPGNPCELDYNTRLGDDRKRYPCTNLIGKVEPHFSNTLGGQCTNKKIEGNEYIKGKDFGACAPFRRLHLCHHNLETINNTTSTAKHDLLAEVCMAAKYEGGLIKTHYTGHQVTNPDTKSQLCTVLARSFADIGDIVRGRDIFRGNDEEKKQREKLDKKLKEIFTQIYNDVTNDQTKKAEAEKRYKGDTDNYYELREDWWTLNRDQVWKAITCEANGTYFHATCGGGKTLAKNNCRCKDENGKKTGKAGGDVNIVPTYFDYVPQFLRWFDEWAEDFCRKRKHKLENAKEQCRGRNNDKYCDLNKYDCEQTIRGDERFVEGDCHKCSVACSPFVKWLDNQKLEFLKQKNKYADEIKIYTEGASGGSGGRTKRAAGGTTTTNYDGYESKFYKKMKEKKKYVKVGEFLDLLSKETTCTKNTEIKEGGQIDFKNVKRSSAKNSDGNNETFYRTTYCEACPWCGAQKKSGGNGKWEAIDDKTCGIGKEYGNYENTPIPILTGDKKKSDMVQKYKKFCNGNGEKGAPGTATGKNGDQIETWKCYYDENKDKNYGSGAINFCVLQDGNVNTKDQKDKSYNVFFWDWVHDMLIDSIKWRTQLGNCINKDKGKTCITGCNKKCICFQKWVERKKEEWDKIKIHFRKQKDIRPEGDLAVLMKHEIVLNELLKKDLLLQIIQDTYRNAKETEHIEELLKDEVKGIAGVLQGKTIIDLLLDHELTDAQTCLDTHKDPCSQQEVTRLRSADTDTEDIPQPRSEVKPDSEDAEVDNSDDDGAGDDSSEEEDEDEVEEEEEPLPEEPKKDEICENGETVNCKDYEVYSTSKCKTKTNLIGLEAHFYKGGVDYPNVYISPRVQQLCLEPLQLLAKTNEDTPDESKLIEALKKCAYNEGRELYQYYKNNKDTIGKNGSKLSDQEIKTYTLEAMKRSYADYGNIVKGDILWDYEKKDQIDLKIIDFAKNHKSTTTSSVSTSDDDDVKRRKLWESIRAHVWKAMICGYENVGASIDNKDLKCKLPDTENTYQFFRWFIEWGENFCIRHEKELKQLREICQKGICNGTDETKKKECKRLCEKYEQFLSNSKIQYETQKPEYDNLMSSIPKHRKKDAIEFLKEKCNAGFSCFKDVNENEHNKIFQYPSDEVKNLCTCTSTDTSKTTPTNCIEKAAYELQQKITKNIGNNSKNLKGKEIALFECRKGDHIVVHNNSDYTKKIDKDKLEHFFPSNRYSCKRKGTINVNVEEWDCNNTNINIREKYLCLPPRRRFMCIKKIDDMMSSTVDDKDKFLEVVMEAAKTEGVRILKNFKSENGTNFSEICDDMKYSFADLGDIIRGTDLWKVYPNYHTTEQNLQRIFKNIHNEITKGGSKDKYKYDGRYFHELRNDWWNTNREAIWKAITCSTPRSAYIYKKTNTGENIRSTDMYYYCGYTKEPPYDDYIPQRLRWMKEWGEYVCKILNEKINDMKNECDKCKLNDQKCSDNDDGNKCRSCKEKCKEYTELIHNLKSQFSILEKKYNELYTKAKNNSGGFIKDNDKYVIEFLKKVEEKKGCDMKTLDEYLDKTIHCINYKFNEKEKEKETYAFNLNSNVFKEKCKCGITKDPLDKCPDQNTCTKYHAIQCFGKEHDDNAYWLSTYIKDTKTTNKGVLVPPRRRHLCLRIHESKFLRLRNDIKYFKNFIFSSAFSEAKRLKKVYKDDNNKLLHAMKYSFADIGNVVKGDDMMESPTSDNISKIFRGMKYKGIDRTKWWNENKYHVWESMLCGYRKAVGNTQTNLNCRFPDTDNIPQFLRWFQEWAENFCIHRNKLYDILVAKCKEAKCDENTCDSDPSECTKACRAYENYVLLKKKEYEFQKVKYNAQFKDKNGSPKDASQYFKDKCKDGKCDCLYEKFNSDNNWEKPYDTFDDKNIKDKCDCPKPLPPLPVEPPQAVEPFDSTILQTTIPFGVALALGSIAFLFLKQYL
ncbi:hypothetical protein PFFCH_05578 [Plasmodium falciparum FCH/4]|uniref:Erythrocyte membrane protein 1 n=1 Tax=Plasmodium falciparum FCH/4 TaxID=1036724 RepID=A0A024VER9_PLAFA|nr:hypothetical protein PFFCH_05578 [Plasmodium falciparum FCH/4]